MSNRITVREWATWRISRAVCLLFNLHTLGCRGRVDQDPGTGMWFDRW